MKGKIFNTLVLFVFIYISTISFCFSQGKTILKGQIKQSDGSPLRASAVMLIQFNPATKSFTTVDSAYTDAQGNYKFGGSQSYFILAKPDISFPNELPTYYGNSIFSRQATPVSLNFGEAVTADFITSKKTASNFGSASIGGTVTLGKNLGNVSNLTVFLADKDKRPIAVTATNSSGKFEFKNLALGDYSVWVDFAGVDNTNADVINLNLLNPEKNNLHFQIEDGSLNCVENNYANIKNALADKDNIYILNLNSLQHDVEDKSLVLSDDGTKKLSPHIGEFTNLESLSININEINILPAEIGKLSKLTTLNANINKLAFLPDEIGNLQKLRSLDLGKNNFTKFPDIITKLSSLETLDFESNQIIVLPAAINALKNLKELNLSSCFELTALPPQIGELSNLETLDLSNCTKLKSLPRELNNLKNLKVLDIQGTKLNVNSFKKAVPGCEVRVTKK